LVRDVTLNVNIALSEPLLGAAGVLISAFTKFDEYYICIAIITMKYEITSKQCSITELTEVDRRLRRIKNGIAGIGVYTIWYMA